jgi:hypothetical protein
MFNKLINSTHVLIDNKKHAMIAKGKLLSYLNTDKPYSLLNRDFAFLIGDILAYLVLTGRYSIASLLHTTVNSLNATIDKVFIPKLFYYFSNTTIKSGYTSNSWNYVVKFDKEELTLAIKMAPKYNQSSSYILYTCKYRATQQKKIEIANRSILREVSIDFEESSFDTLSQVIGEELSPLQTIYLREVFMEMARFFLGDLCH